MKLHYLQSNHRLQSNEKLSRQETEEEKSQREIVSVSSARLHLRLRCIWLRGGVSVSSSMGSKRQLPPWMLRAAATDQVSNSVSEAKHRGNGLEELPTEACHPDSSVEVQQHVAEVTKTDLCLVKKCKTTRSRRKPVKRAEDDVSNMHEGDVEKENYALPRRKRKAKVLKAAKSNAVEESTLSEDELRVDDLISIAKEYINNAEKGKEGQRSSFAECESESLPQSISSRDKTTHKDVNTLECQPSERGVISSSRTGEELTQDLLELFLGPFVRTEPP